MRLGEFSKGQTTVPLQGTNLPSHTHSASLQAAMESEEQDTTDPDGGYLGGNSSRCANQFVKNPVQEDFVAMSTESVTLQHTGEGQQPEHNNMQPYIVVNYIIALTGLFPSRS